MIDKKNKADHKAKKQSITERWILELIKFAIIPFPLKISNINRHTIKIILINPSQTDRQTNIDGL